MSFYDLYVQTDVEGGPAFDLHEIMEKMGKADSDGKELMARILAASHPVTIDASPDAVFSADQLRAGV